MRVNAPNEPTVNNPKIVPGSGTVSGIVVEREVKVRVEPSKSTTPKNRLRLGVPTEVKPANPINSDPVSVITGRS
nr:hypothetical protein [Okeania hirsuta]